MATVKIILWVALAGNMLAADFTAASCSNANVQSSINSASTGDRVIVPSGSCTWTSTVTISSKGITLVGAGIGSTNITDQGSGGAALDISGTSATNFVDVSGFTFIKSTDHSSGIIQFDGTQATVGFRFHHNRILHGASGSRGIEIVNVYGLIDHVTFDVTATSGSIQNVSIFGSSDGSDGGFTPWTRALSFGTNNAVYIEDCAFNYAVGAQAEDSIDAYGGARFVIRHNTFLNITVGFHGNDSGDRRSAFSHEVYSNTFTNNSSTTLRGGTVRGGTGVWHDNTYGGSQGWNGITLMLYRACPTLDQSGWGTCDGTNWQIGSTNFSAQASRTASTSGGVKFCSTARDTVCTSDAVCTAIGGGTCSTFLDGAGTGGYACRDQPGRTHDQALAPIYGWNNGSMSIGTYDGGFSCGTGLSTYLQSGRDYVDSTTMPGYTAYTYPHPLAAAGSILTPPSALKAGVQTSGIR